MRIMYSCYGNKSVLDVSKAEESGSNLTFTPIKDGLPRVMIRVNEEYRKEIMRSLLSAGFADLSAFGNTTILY